MRLSRFAAACLAAAFAASAGAQDDAPDPPRIDPAALEAARAMGERLRALDAFTIEATLSTEEVLESGETLLHLERLTADIDPPGALRMELSSPGASGCSSMTGRGPCSGARSRATTRP